MDGQRFDELTRTLATGASRRRFLKGLAAGASVALFGRTTASAEEACPVALDLFEPCAAKVGICHRTSSDTNPYRYIEVCVDAVPAHATHGDLVACPTNQVIEPESCTCICDPTITCGDGELLNPETCECETQTCLGVLGDCGGPGGPDPNRPCCSDLMCELIPVFDGGEQIGAGYFCVETEGCHVEGFELICPS